MSTSTQQKIGIVIHEKYEYGCYEPILACLPKNAYECIVPDARAIATAGSLFNTVVSEIYYFSNFLKFYPLGHYKASAREVLPDAPTMREVAERQQRYACLVWRHECDSDWYRIDGKGHYLAQDISDCLVYLPLHMCMDPVFMLENAVPYQLILCPSRQVQANMDALNMAAKALLVGSPRFGKSVVPYQPARLDPNKKTLLWLPCHGVATSLMRFLEPMAQLQDRYNVVVSFPISGQQSIYMEQFGWRWKVERKLRHVLYNVSSARLFHCADVVLADYGNSAISALMNDKPLLLLDAPEEAVNREYCGFQDDAPEYLIRKHILHVGESEAGRIASILEDGAYWQAQTAVRAQLRERFGSPFPPEQSAQIIARLLLQLRDGVQLENLTVEA